MSQISEIVQKPSKDNLKADGGYKAMGELFGRNIYHVDRPGLNESNFFRSDLKIMSRY